MALRRIKPTQSLGHLNQQERQKILTHAFQVNEQYRTKLLNRRVILIDDVMTTGATLSACTTILLKAGVKAVYGVVIARTHKEVRSYKEERESRQNQENIHEEERWIGL